MKTIGICIPTIEGGVVCHQEIGREAMRRGIAYPPIVTHTPLFEGIDQAVKTGDFDSLVAVLSESINRTAQAGAEFAIIPSNTPHIVLDETAKHSTIPVLSILEVTAGYCEKHGYKRVGILGTIPTVRNGLYDASLAKRGIASVYTSESEQDRVHDIIQTELIRGIFRNETRNELVGIAQQLAPKCDAIILGCTELPLILDEENCGIKVVDTTRNLAHAALDFAVRE
ncbi:Aspartate racemase [Penicillium cataractarum]|uniref:Aspartate racemase n=1 Tax=Penicillium cataractarum TaxID=2100454 RepID=A0A9W9RH88_9EURO|nr:Aspartate racemase [Penicillium cataractarum]KAJ5359234.1 Aspartate racemase [Penicillium cataractarum]